MINNKIDFKVLAAKLRIKMREYKFSALHLKIGIIVLCGIVGVVVIAKGIVRIASKPDLRSIEENNPEAPDSLKSPPEKKNLPGEKLSQEAEKNVLLSDPFSSPLKKNKEGSLPTSKTLSLSGILCKENGSAAVINNQGTPGDWRCGVKADKVFRKGPVAGAASS